MTRRSRAAAALFGAALVAGIGLLAPVASASTEVIGGGSGFAALELQQWTANTARAPYDLNVQYTASSSGGGRVNYAPQGSSLALFDYAASDIIYNAEDGSLATSIQSQRPFKYVTVSAGGLSFMYDIVIGGARFSGLNLTRSEVCQIFTGGLTKWNDPELVATPGDSVLAADDNPINVITRSDSAGESYVLSQYCISVDPGDWTNFKNFTVPNENNESYSDPNMANGLPVSLWPSQLLGGITTAQYSGADGVANAVEDPNTGANGITYDAAGYAKVRNAPVASIENGAGVFTQPNGNSVQLALSYAAPNPQGTFNLDFNGTNPYAYFPSTYSYVIMPTTLAAPSTAATSAALTEFLCYSIGEGQNNAAQLQFAPLSAQVTALSVAAVETAPGAPPAASCGVGGPQPQVVANGGGISGNNGGAAAATTTNGQPAASGGLKTVSGAVIPATGGSVAAGTAAAAAAAAVASTQQAAAAAGSTAVVGAGAAPAGALTPASVGGLTLTGSGTQLAAGPLAQQTITSVPTVAASSLHSGGSNYQAVLYVGLGALLCALGFGAVGARKQG